MASREKPNIIRQNDTWVHDKLNLPNKNPKKLYNTQDFSDKKLCIFYSRPSNEEIIF